jgi:acyl carrier protein
MPLDPTTTFNKVRDIIIENLGSEPDAITSEARFEEDLGADSLDQLELTIALEEEFGVDIPDEKALKLLTVQQAVDHIISLSA